MIALVLIFFLLGSCQNQVVKQIEVDVLVLQAGTGGTTAAIQSSRMGAKTLLVEPTAWPGGMLTSAGVSAIDGNHEMPAGLWGEFREALREYYGGPKALQTGWVTHTAFEPKVGKQILEEFIEDEKNNLTYWPNTLWKNITREQNHWSVTLIKGDSIFELKAPILIDGTDLGDVLAEVGAAFDLGMESRTQSEEYIALDSANDVIQDLTFTAILKDFGPESDNTIERPKDYNPNIFGCACLEFCTEPKEGIHPCATMMTYAKLPNEKYLINWPLKGNDLYLNLVPLNRAERQIAIEEAKKKTLQFVYFIQHELGYKNLGLADDEFPTKDLLPLIPYHREGRRLQGLVRFNLNYILKPYDTELPLYRTGIAVGDYPIDHHHKERKDIPDIDFPPVPSFNVPLGALVPKEVEGLIVADKAISVSNIVNGSTRLQPVIMQIGQAAGALAVISLRENLPLSKVPVRLVQKALLDEGGYLVPSYDVKPDHPYFNAIQKIASTGLLLGTGEPYAWANRTYYFPDEYLLVSDLKKGVQEYGIDFEVNTSKNIIDLASTIELANAIADKELTYNSVRKVINSEDFNPDFPDKLTRGEFAMVIDILAKPFENQSINYQGLVVK